VARDFDKEDGPEGQRRRRADDDRDGGDRLWRGESHGIHEFSVQNEAVPNYRITRMGRSPFCFFRFTSGLFFGSKNARLSFLGHRLSLTFVKSPLSSFISLRSPFSLHCLLNGERFTVRGQMVPEWKTCHIPIAQDFWDSSSLVQENTIKTEKNEKKKKKEIKTAKVFVRLVVGHAITKQVRAVFREHSQSTVGSLQMGIILDFWSVAGFSIVASFFHKLYI
jgi:hypothetical protein